MKTETKTKEDNRSKEQALAQLESIVKMIAALEKAKDENDDAAIEAAQNAIQCDPLSAEVRTDWHSPGDEDTKPTHFRILLCTGGPAVQITGELSIYGEPETAELEHQDWFIPWTRCCNNTEQQYAALLAYAQEFYFGN